MRDVQARARALLVAVLAASVLLAVLGPQVSLASTPAGLGKFMNAIGHVESGGRYTARNTISGAYGKYQIMPSNWPSWARRYLGDATAKPTAVNQELVARGKFTTLYRSLGSWRRVAYWWLTGSSQATGWSLYARHYVDKVLARYAISSSRIPTGVGVGGVVLRHLSETNAHIAYTGTWKSAAFHAYAGDHVAYATQAGATASVTFTGKRITWYGPVGPTRGAATISIDGTVVGTVDLHRRGFAARAAVYTKAWSSAGTRWSRSTSSSSGRSQAQRAAITSISTR